MSWLFRPGLQDFLSDIGFLSRFIEVASSKWPYRFEFKF